MLNLLYVETCPFFVSYDKGKQMFLPTNLRLINNPCKPVWYANYI